MIGGDVLDLGCRDLGDHDGVADGIGGPLFALGPLGILIQPEDCLTVWRGHSMSTRSLPPEINRHVNVWWYSHSAWLLGYFALGALGIGLPAIIASGLIADVSLTKGVAVAATVISGLQTFLKCDSRAIGFHIAWRHLSKAKLKYENEEGYPISEVIEAYDRGEQWIESIFTPVDERSEKTPQISN